MGLKTNLSYESRYSSEPTHKITVIIPVLNMEDKISYCLEAIFDQSYLPHEVIVVDGHSKDDTVANAQKFNVQVLYENYHTRAGANQVGIEAAKGDYIAFTDADCIPDKYWLKNLISGFGIDVVGVGGSVHNIGDSLWQKSINLSQDTFLGAANSIQGRYYKQKKFVNSISGCNCLYRKEDLIKVGGFRTDLLTAEDTELNKRLLRHGKLLYVPNAVIIHKHGRGLSNFSKRMYQYGLGRANASVLDIQIIPPILAIFVLIFAFVNFKFFLSSLLIYILILCVFTVKIVLKHPNPYYFISIPLTYVVEHVSYTLGFWKGIFMMLF